MISIDLEVTLEASFNINDFKLGRPIETVSFRLVNDLAEPHVLRLSPQIGISCVQEGKKTGAIGGFKNGWRCSKGIYKLRANKLMRFLHLKP